MTKAKQLIRRWVISAAVGVKIMSENECQFWEIDKRLPRSTVYKPVDYIICDMLSEVYAGRRNWLSASELKRQNC